MVLLRLFRGSRPASAACAPCWPRGSTGVAGAEGFRFCCGGGAHLAAACRLLRRAGLRSRLASALLRRCASRAGGADVSIRRGFAIRAASGAPGGFLARRGRFGVRWAVSVRFVVPLRATSRRSGRFARTGLAKLPGRRSRRDGRITVVAAARSRVGLGALCACSPLNRGSLRCGFSRAPPLPVAWLARGRLPLPPPPLNS